MTCLAASAQHLIGSQRIASELHGICTSLLFSLCVSCPLSLVVLLCSVLSPSSLSFSYRSRLSLLHYLLSLSLSVISLLSLYIALLYLSLAVPLLCVFNIYIHPHIVSPPLCILHLCALALFYSKPCLHSHLPETGGRQVRWGKRQAGMHVRWLSV